MNCFKVQNKVQERICIEEMRETKYAKCYKTRIRNRKIFAINYWLRQFVHGNIMEPTWFFRKTCKSQKLLHGISKISNKCNFIYFFFIWKRDCANNILYFGIFEHEGWIIAIKISFFQKKKNREKHKFQKVHLNQSFVIFIYLVCLWKNKREEFIWSN